MPHPNESIFAVLPPSSAATVPTHLSDEDVINGAKHSEAAKVHAQKHFVSTDETTNVNIQNGFFSQACATVTIILTWGLIGHDLNGSSSAFTIAVLIKRFVPIKRSNGLPRRECE
jgi:hypothetical protein